MPGEKKYITCPSIGLHRSAAQHQTGSLPEILWNSSGCHQKGLDSAVIYVNFMSRG